MDTSTPPLKSSGSTLTKPNELLVLVPLVGNKLSAVSRKIFNTLLLVGGEEFRRRRYSGNPMLAEETFSARLTDLVAHLPGESSNWSSTAAVHLKEMLDTKVVWNSIDRNTDTTRWGAMPLLSLAEVTHSGRGKPTYVRWAFPPDVMTALKDPAFFTKLDLEILGQLKSYASIALYEICSRYKTNPSGLSCSQPPAWWVEALTARGFRPAPASSNAKKPADTLLETGPKREWRKVKFETVLGAIEEINSKTDLEIELIEKREGKAVSEVQFAVRRKRRALPPGQGIAPDVLEKAVSLGISAADIAMICRTARGGVDVVKAALSKLSERVARDDLVPLSNVTAYLKTILGELDEYVATSPAAAPSPQSGVRQATTTTVLRSTTPTEVVDLVETPESLAKKQIEALDRPAQELLAKAAFERMQAKGMATAAVVQAYAKYKGGGPLAGVLLGEMTRQHLQQAAAA